MAGIAIILDLLRKNPNFYSTQSVVHSSGFFSSTAAAAAAISASTPFASRFLFGYPKTQVAYCDAGVGFPDGYISNVQRASSNIFQHDALKYNTKEYNIVLKPLFSAFEVRALAITSLRSFLMYYLPLLDPTNTEEDDNDFLQDTLEEHHVDLVVPFKKSVKQIVCETTIVTTRRILERLAVHYISQRMACKLLKGYLLGVAAAWLVQVGIEIYRCFSRIFKSEEESNEVDKLEQVKVLRKRVSCVTIKCGASLVFASIGAGIGAVLIRPSLGQWIGCAAGDLAGPVIVSFCLGKLLHVDL